MCCDKCGQEITGDKYYSVNLITYNKYDGSKVKSNLDEDRKYCEFCMYEIEHHL